MINNLKLFFSEQFARTAGIVFALNSLMFGSWVTHLPEIKVNLQITDGELGIALLGVPLGSIIAMPVMGWVIHKLGSGKTTIIYGLAFCLISSFPVLAPTYLSFFIALIFVGMSTGSMDVAMNAAAASVEKKLNRNIMSSCHGMWSFGGMIGAGTTSLLVGLKVNPAFHIIILAVVLLVILFAMTPVMLSIRDEKTDSVMMLSLPKGPLIGLAIIGFCIMMGEGAIYDWSAIYLKDTLLANAFYSGLGYAGFSMTMAGGRFYGDLMIHTWGAKKTIIIGALISFGGVLVAILLPYPLIVIAGFTIAGMGFSCLIPAVYITASRTPGGSAGSNLAAVASLGYFGLLAGPPFIGMIANHFGLRAGFIVVILLMGIVVLLARKSRFS